MENKRKKKFVKEKVNSDESMFWFLTDKGIGASFVCVAVFGLLIRACISIHPYSGAGNPPKFGDFEAQRHWMEITVNLPVKEWYRNGTDNDLRYWGIDYPPLSAYQSYVHGLFLKFFAPDSVSLFISRGHESYLGKLLMRWTVLSSDVLIFFPAVLFFVLAYYGSHHPSGSKRDMIVWHIAIILLNPSLILIDHGHFQFNCISLGLAVGAIAAVLSQRDFLASVLFCLSLNHKQMSLYFAPAFFGHLLGKCIRRKNPLLEVLKLGVVVLGTFAVVWWPYLQSTDAFFGVLRRLAPFERGIFEDYVANFWCTSSVVIKWKRLLTAQCLKFVCLVATVLTFLPSMVQQILSPSNKGFLYALLNSSLAFFLFSFQVHEKSILLPLLPATLLATELGHSFKLLTYYALFSMFPLLRRDGLIVPYMVLHVLFVLIFHAPCRRQETKKDPTDIPILSVMTYFLQICSLVLHVVYLTINPPQKYPYLFEAAIMLLCFSHFILFTLYTNVKQWMLSRELTFSDKEHKLD